MKKTVVNKKIDVLFIAFNEIAIQNLYTRIKGGFNTHRVNSIKGAIDFLIFDDVTRIKIVVLDESIKKELSIPRIARGMKNLKKLCALTLIANINSPDLQKWFLEQECDFAGNVEGIASVIEPLIIWIQMIDNLGIAIKNQNFEQISKIHKKEQEIYTKYQKYPPGMAIRFESLSFLTRQLLNAE